MNLAAIAAELGIDERSVRRDEIALLAKLRAAFAGSTHSPHVIARVIILILQERTPANTDATIPRRFSTIAPQSDHAPRVFTADESSASPPGVDGDRVRAGHLPQRFRRRP